MTRPGIAGISPFFIVADVAATLSFYRDMLDFEVTFQELDQQQRPFFAIVRRGAAMIMVKDVGVEPLPNCEREPGGAMGCLSLCARSGCIGGGVRFARCRLLSASQGHA